MRIFQPTVTGSNTTTGSLHISGPVYFYTLETSSVFHVLTYNTSSGQVFYTASDAIGKKPGEPDQSIQFNDGGEFSGSVNFTFNGTDIVYLTGSMLVSGAISASYGSDTVGFYGTASWAQSASNALFAQTASFITASNVWGPFGSSSVASASFASSSISASYAETASLAYTALFITASNVWGIFGSSSVDSASFASSSISASYAETASFVLNPYPINVTGSSLYSVAPVAGVPNIPVANNSIFFGNGAGFGAPLAANSNFLGYQAGYNGAFVSNANFIGYLAGRDATYSNNSNFIGYRAGFHATASTNSNFIGTTAGEEAINAQESNFIGYYAGYQATDAQKSNFIGYTVGRSASNAAYSNFLGYSAGDYAVNASHSILIGSKAGYNNLTTANNSVGPNNIILGTNITLPPASKDSINIGGLIFATGSHSDFLAINPLPTPAGGNVGINIYPPLYNFHVSGTVAFPNLTTSSQINVVIIDTASGQLFYTSSTAVGGGGGTPAPSDTYIQFNSGGLFGGDSSFRYIYASHSLQQGDNVVASGDYSHAQGSSSIASGDYSHVEGRGNQAIGEGSHAEGRNNYASASWSHVGGLQNTSSGIYQTVVGQNSIQLVSQSAFIVGGGRATNDRSNALVVIPKTTTGNFQSDSILEILVESASISASYLYLNNLPTSPELNVLVYNSESNRVFYTSSTSVGGGGSGNPAPSDTYVQYNNNDEFGAEIFFKYAYVSHSLLLGEAMGSQGDFGIPPSFGRFSVHLGEGSATAINGAYSASMVSGNIVLDAVYGDATSNFPNDGVFYGGNLYTSDGSPIQRNYFEKSSVTFNGTNTIISSSTDNSLSSFNPLFPLNFYPGFVADPLDQGNWNGNIYTADEGTFNSGFGALATGIYSYAFGVGSHAEGNGSVSIGNYSHAEGNVNIAGGYGSHAEGSTTRAIGNYSHAEGGASIASGTYSHAEGDNGYAIGFASHAEGSNNYAIGDYSHAEGSANYAIGTYSHAEGENTIAFGYGSHAEGYLTLASGSYSNTKGFGTTASGDYQLVVGAYNQSINSSSAFIIGDGTELNRHNVLFVSKSHFEVSASTVYLQGLPASSELNILVYNSSSGQVYYTASNNLSTNVFPYTGSAGITGSITLTGSMFVSGAISASFGSNTVGFFGTSSWAQSASQALTASFSPNFANTNLTFTNNRTHTGGGFEYRFFNSGSILDYKGGNQIIESSQHVLGIREPKGGGNNEIAFIQMTTSSLIIGVGDENNALSGLRQLTITTSSITLTGSLNISGAVYFPTLETASVSHIVMYNTSSGQLYFTASSAVGGGGSSTFNSTSSVIGNGLSSSYDINHGFNTRNLHITVYENFGPNYETVYPDIRRINLNTASIVFANPVSAINQYVVYISQ
jgi:hypothetical protein